MLHKLSSDGLSGHVAGLNALHNDCSALSVLDYGMSNANLGQVALVSSFGAESVVLLHMVSLIDRSLPILFLDTQMLFQETLDYQIAVATHLKLTDVRTIRPDPQRLKALDPDNTLHQRNFDACCALRKTQPLERALTPFDSWISGRKRYQGTRRAHLEFFEVDGGDRIKVNPLAHWTSVHVKDYINKYNLPPHPLVTKGYPSIGCATCTTHIVNGEDQRAGRWRGQEKDECGIHFVNGRVIAGPGFNGDQS